MSHLEGRREVELPDLRADGGEDLGSGMPERGAPQAREAIEQPASIRADEVRALRAGDERGVLLEVPDGGERHPEGSQVCGCIHGANMSVARPPTALHSCR